jgi:hypothetical protein
MLRLGIANPIRMRPILLLLCLSFLSAAKGQFGPEHLAFESDVKYPGKIFIDDVNGDGFLDVIIHHSSTPASTGLYWWANDGLGNFQQKFKISPAFNFPLHEGDPFVDLNGDGFPDMLAPNNWYPGNAQHQFDVNSPVPYQAGFLLHFHADIDGDGDVDLFGQVGGELKALLNNGSGIFTPGPGIPFTGAVTASYTHVNGDGISDLLVSGDNSARGWYAGLGNGNFGPLQTIAVFNEPFAARIGDVDGNGTIDLIRWSSNPGTRWFSNNGSGIFTEMDTIQHALWGEFGDIDGDGDLDFCAGTGTTCDVKWVRNDGGGLAWSVQTTELFSAYNLAGTRQALGDLNGDGLVDMAFANGQGIAGWYPLLPNGEHGPRRRIGQMMAGGNGLQVVDVDLDGDLDVVASSFHGDWLTWYENNGDGTFGEQILIAEYLEKVKLLGAADLDGDGDIDLVTNNADAAIVWNNNAGSSWTPAMLPNGAVPRGLGDLDNDGDMDIIAFGAWYRNTNGQFTEVPEPLIDPETKRLNSGDMNGDGLTDLVISGYSQGGQSPFVRVLLGNGNGFSVAWEAPLLIVHFGIGDLDGDGDMDIAVINQGTTHSWYENDGSGQFTQHVWITGAPSGGRAIFVRDINGDGVADIVWSRSQNYDHQTYFTLNDGNGNFGPNTIIDPAAEVTSEFVLADVNGDVVADLVSIRHHSITWRENHFFDAFRLRGEVFKDFNANGVKDGFDDGVPYRLMRTDPQAMMVWTNSHGGYDLPVDSGITYDLWPQLTPSFQVTSDPAVHVVEANADQPIVSGLDFGVGPVVGANAEMLTLTTSNFRCNMEGSIWAVVRNTGSWISEDLVISMTLHEDLTFSGAWPPPDSISNGTLYWHLDSLPWFAVHNFSISVLAGPVGSTASAHVEVEFADATPTLEASFSDMVTCAYDPNDKQVLPIGHGSHGAIPIDTEWLDYTIRFQNTGNDTAFSVVLVDHLSHDLDRASMEVLGTSHDLAHIGIDLNGKLQFRYEPIMLPDSGANMAASNGYVRFRIRPAAGVASGTVIQNTAEIYFDLNLPIITNTVTNTLIDCGLHTATYTVIGTDHLHAAEGAAWQWFYNGEEIEGATSPELVLFATGSYAVRITSSDGCISMSEPYLLLLTTVPETHSLNMALIPNPASTHTRVICSAILNSTDMVEVIDAHGRVAGRVRGNGTRELLLPVDRMESGIYVVRVMKDGQPMGAMRMVVAGQ